MRSSEKYAQRPELLKTHPVLKRLLTLKQSLSTLEDLDFAASDEESDIDDDDESLSLNMDASPTDKPPKKKRKTDSAESKKPAVPVFDLVEPVYNRSKPLSSNVTADKSSTDAYGEATFLQHADQADKNARKKSLRFHTSKIESASARRQGARNNAVGGDDDIPYREGRKEKEARMTKESEKKAKSRGQGGDDLDDVEPGDDVRKRPREQENDESDGEEGADGYYELVKRKVKERKEKKKIDYEEAQAAARSVFRLRCAWFLLIVESQTGLPGRHHCRAAVTYPRNLIQQRPHTSPVEKRPQSPSQEKTEVRKGEKEGLISKSCLQGWHWGYREI
jgi:U3 small nucleolar RNA-associated protein 3